MQNRTSLRTALGGCSPTTSRGPSLLSCDTRPVGGALRSHVMRLSRHADAMWSILARLIVQAHNGRICAATASSPTSSPHRTGGYLRAQVLFQLDPSRLPD